MKEFYDATPALNSIGNSATLYAGIKAAGVLAAYYSGNRDLDDIADFLAPGAAGWYLCDRVNAITDHDNIKDILHTTIIGGMSADIGRLVSDYDQGISAVHTLRHQMSGVSTFLSNNVPFLQSAEAQSFAGGFLGAAIYKVIKHYREG